MLFDRRHSLERRLNRLAPIVFVGGLFLTLSVLCFISMCNMPCEDRTYAVDHETLRKARNKAFWNDNFLAPNREVRVKLVVLIITGPSNLHERDAIRGTWMSGVNLDDVLFRFVIGTGSLSADVKNAIGRENLVHKDLIMLENVNDSYQGLTNKVLQSFVWLDRTVDYQYVLKVDDDSYVRVSNVLSELQHKPKEKLYWGFFDGRANVKRTGKWREPDWVLCDKYLPYARGGGYVLSYDLVHFIASNHELLQQFVSEDVSVGTWLAPLKIFRHHDQNFDTEYISRGCSNSYLIMHKQPVVKLRELYNNLQRTGHLCDKEYVVRESYEYDWNVPPSKCCQRPDPPKNKIEGNDNANSNIKRNGIRR